MPGEENEGKVGGNVGIILSWFSPVEGGSNVFVGGVGDREWDGGVVDAGDASQLGGVPGSMEIVVPGRRSTGC